MSAHSGVFQSPDTLASYVFVILPPRLGLMPNAFNCWVDGDESMGRSVLIILVLALLQSQSKSSCSAAAKGKMWVQQKR